MAQVYGPLHSESASGQFAGTLIYQPYKGKTYVKAYGKPDWDVHPPTAAQLAVQAMNKSLMEAWPAISAADKATWDALAIPARISRVNAYLRENFKRLRSGRAATSLWPAVEAPAYALNIAHSGDIPNPDCRGDYNQIADYNSHPAYERASDSAYSVWFDTDLTAWIIAAQAPGTLPDDYWTDANLEDVFDPYGGYYTGNPWPDLY